MIKQVFTIESPLEVRAGSNGPTAIEGYAAVFHIEGDTSTEFRPAESVVERIMPTAFDSTLQSDIDIVATYDHNTERILGRTSTDTLRVSTDKRGLRFSIPYQPADPDHQLVAGKIQRRLVTGASFSFAVAEGGEEIRHEKSQTVRELHAVNLHELGPVSMPAYYGSDAAVRCAGGWTKYRKQRIRLEQYRKLQIERLRNGH